MDYVYPRSIGQDPFSHGRMGPLYGPRSNLKYVFGGYFNDQNLSCTNVKFWNLIFKKLDKHL